jgi:hypothetical protein
MSTHFPRITLRVIVLVTFLAVTQSSSNHVFAQAPTNTPRPAKPLPLNKLVSGQFRGKGEVATYALDIPSDQDVIVEYRANKLVFSTYCIFTEASPLDDDHCSKTGGSGGDRPVNGSHFIPTHGQQGQQATINLYRVLDGVSTYQIIAYTVTPQTIDFGSEVSTDATNANAHDYHTYTINAAPSNPFTVDVEDEAPDGNFLWATYQPFTYPAFPNVETPALFLPDSIDVAYGPNGATGVQVLQMFYLGEHTFRILVQSANPFKLISTNSLLPTLSENQTTSAKVSYRQPVVVIPLNAQPGRQAQINFKVTRGKGAIVRVYESGNNIDQGLSLGWSGANADVFDLSGNVQRTTIKALYAVVQIPYNYTRDIVSVAVSWQHVS